MISVQEADSIIFNDILTFAKSKVSLDQSFGLILQEDIVADRDFPPFHRVAMDGIAINLSAWNKGVRVFPIEGTQKAGSPRLKLRDEKACLEVMTGAVLSIGCDCVIPVENIEVKENAAYLRDGFKVVHMLNVHQQGADGKQRDVVLKKGIRLCSPQVAIAASVGKSMICVTQQPKIAIIGTGDELVAIDQKPEVYQIRQSNAYALKSALQTHNFTDFTHFHIRDDRVILEEQLKEILKDFDVIILSGGVSMGKFDFVPRVLDSLGVKVLFHKVRQRPGKPFWFGKSKESKPVFALPGNPVATQIGVYRYVLPYLNKASGLISAKKEYACLSEDVDVKTPFTYFLPVKIISTEDGCRTVVPVYTGGSGDFAALGRTDGFIELPSDTFHFLKGLAVPFYQW
ncbi:Molybdopterin molybdenumtransferase [hydrothermal vent metagenome]|uniref:Molybdopterin molybdenumtransferase n=1 Tax=hydrothermal vent metagenome TaxID=652676 RepID=A0A3B1D5G4_9ZZZZ